MLNDVARCIRDTSSNLIAGQYELLEEIARGGMATVYRARHRGLDKLVAVKVMQPDASADRFLREARLLARIHSPHVVAVHDFAVIEGGRPMLVMDWVEGNDLARIVREHGGPLEEEQAFPWMRQVAEGMLAAAEVGITHRDLKPSNILIDRQGRAWVADFGVARGPVDLSNLTQSNQVMGTPHYMAPEQAESPHNVDTRADIYSFGATFYHVLTGSVPFKGESVFAILFKHKTEPLVAPQARNRKLSDRTSALLERCLAKSPAQRFASFAELLDHLQAVPSRVSPWDDENDPELVRCMAEYQQRRDVYLYHAGSLRAPEIFRFPGGRALQIIHGDLVHQRADAIVSSDDAHLSMSGGVSMAIRLAAGSDEMERETRKYVPVRPGRAVVTSAGMLNARFVFHGVTLAFTGHRVFWPSRDLIVEILQDCVRHADALYVRSLALPLLGTGAGRLPRPICLDTMFQFLAKNLLRGLTPLQDVRIVLDR